MKQPKLKIGDRVKVIDKNCITYNHIGKITSINEKPLMPYSVSGKYFYGMYVESNLQLIPNTKSKEDKINWDIDVRYEEDILKAFDKFIEKWCGNNSAHLLDSDEQDGEFMRDKIRDILAKQYQPNKEPIDLGKNATCHKCGKQLCTCKERQWDRSWKQDKPVERLMGYDTDCKDKTCKVYGYTKENMIFITRVEFEDKPVCKHKNIKEKKIPFCLDCNRYLIEPVPTQTTKQECSCGGGYTTCNGERHHYDNCKSKTTKHLDTLVVPTKMICWERISEGHTQIVECRDKLNEIIDYLNQKEL